MSKSTLDAATLADRMNARPGNTQEWSWQYPDGDVCDKCERTMFRPETCVCEAYGDFMCLPCAKAECERAEKEGGK